VTASDRDRAILSTYSFPDEVRVDSLVVRGPTHADVDEIAPAFLDPEIGGEAGLPPFDVEMLHSIMDEQLPAMRERGLLAAYVIVDGETAVGGFTLHHFDPMRDAVEVGYWLFPHARGRGVATRVLGAMVEHAFANGIRRVEAHVRLANTASERVLERLGFTREGVRRRFLRYEGAYADATIFSRLVDDA
jgi:RimJ/RimL family protein N-acetyltransferase